jgi:hypothetical protein
VVSNGFRYPPAMQEADIRPYQILQTGVNDTFSSQLKRLYLRKKKRQTHTPSRAVFHTPPLVLFATFHED